jgi:ribosome-associated translation inhibitor RaiA
MTSRLEPATLDVHFHGLERSAAIEAKVNDRFRKLTRHLARMTACRVVLEAASRNAAKAKLFKVKIEVLLPSRKPLVITHEREGGSAQDDLALAIRDAFEAAIRRVDEVGTKIAHRTRLDRGRRRPAPQPA